MADDRDMKIYVKKTSTETGEFRTLTENIRRHIAYGNCEKAMALGEKLAKVKAEDNVVELDRYSLSAAQLYQIRVLLTFAAEYSVQKYIPVEFLADSVSSAMYDYLKINEPGYYDNISDGGAFTFYLLALKKDGDTAHNVGEQFAMLCAINNPEIVSLGASVFEKGTRFFAELINEADFKNVE